MLTHLPYTTLFRTEGDQPFHHHVGPQCVSNVSSQAGVKVLHLGTDTEDEGVVLGEGVSGHEQANRCDSTQKGMTDSLHDSSRYCWCRRLCRRPDFLWLSG